MFAAMDRDIMIVPDCGSASRRTGGEWQECGSPGFLVQPLLDDPAVGLRSLLMRIEPGAEADMHAHDGEIEQVYVLDGEFSDGEAHHGKGDFIVRAAGAPHCTTSKDGALLMVTYARHEGEAA